MSALGYSHCDGAWAQACRTVDAPAHPRLVLATTVLASSLAFIDGSVVNVGLPAIGDSLGADDAQLPWIINLYLLPLSALLLLGGAAGDRWGRRTMLVAGVVVFAAASVLCALAPDLGWMLAGRALQGVGAALLMPNSLAILGQSFSGPAKGRAVGVWAAAGAAAGAAGPLIGGAFVDAGWWRAIFLINLPLAALAVVLALYAVPRDRPASAGAPLDGMGALLVSAGLGGLAWGLTLGAGPGGWTAVAAALVAAGALLLVAFVLVERRRGAAAMMPLALFASRPFVGLTLLTLLLYGALGALTLLLPYVLIEGSGYSGSAAGAALLPLPLVLALASPLLGGWSSRIGARWPLTLGPLAVAAGLLMLLRVGSDTPYGVGVLPALLVIAVGLAGAVAPLTTAVLGAVDAQHAGAASGFNSAIARAGGLVATALLGGALTARGEPLLGALHVAAVIAAAACLAAAASAFTLYRD